MGNAGMGWLLTLGWLLLGLYLLVLLAVSAALGAVEALRSAFRRLAGERHGTHFAHIQEVDHS